MRYAIIKCINSNYAVHAEGIETVQAAKISYHSLCAALWNDPSVITARVMIADEQLDAVEGYREFIHHEQEQTNEPV